MRNVAPDNSDVSNGSSASPHARGKVMEIPCKQGRAGPPEYTMQLFQGALHVASMETLPIYCRFQVKYRVSAVSFQNPETFLVTILSIESFRRHKATRKIVDVKIKDLNGVKNCRWF